MRKSLIKKGFTIVELVIVIAVIAVLAAVLIPTFSNVIDKANESAALTTAKNLYKEYVVENADTGKLLDDLYIEVDGGYIHYVKGEAVKEDDGKYVVTEIPDEAYVVPYTLAVFSFGENVNNGHNDGNTLETEVSYTNGDYTLSFTDMSKVFGPAYDALGNSCIKLGSSENIGSFSLEVPEKVNAVSFYISGYKTASANVSIETESKNYALLTKSLSDTTFVIDTISNNGEYTAITIDTSSNKIVKFSTSSASKRCMINTIKYLKNLPGGNNESSDIEDDGLIAKTINFDNKTKRIAFDSTQQVWMENNIIVKNIKGNDGNDAKVTDYFSPTRFYKNSTLIITTKNKDLISKLEIRCGNDTSVNNLLDTLENIATASGNLVSVTLDTKTDVFEKIILNGAVYISSITIYCEENENSIEACNHENTLVDVASTDAECEKEGYSVGQYCSNCYEVISAQTIISATGHNFVDGVCQCGEREISPYNITFDDTAKRTVLNDEQQVWTENGITVTNNKASSTSGIADYANPARFYKSSELIISTDNQFAQIIFNCNASSYASALAESLTNNIGIASIDGKIVTITLFEKTNSLTVTMSGQVRVDSIVIDYESEIHEHTEEVMLGFDATCTESGLKDGVKCSVCETIIVTQEEIPAKGHNYVDGICSVCGVEEPENTTITVIIADYAVAKGWTNGTKYTSIDLDENITCTVTGGGNTGKYYTSGTNWRIYQTENPELSISCSNSNIIKKVIITYSVSNTGVLIDEENNNIFSDTEVEVNASSIVFSVGNTGSESNGQVRITKIEVTYGIDDENNNPKEPCVHTEEVLPGKDATCTETGLTEGKKCSECGEVLVAQEEVAAIGHSYENGTCTVCGADDPDYVAPEQPENPSETVTVTLNVKDAATANGWTSASNNLTEAYAIDENISISVAGGSNSGKFYDDHLRIYATDSPAGSITLTAKEGYKIKSVSFNLVTGTYAFLQLDGVTIESEQVVNLDASTVTFNTVKNGSDGKQVRVVAVTVTYAAE